jgi:hypothetical protein
VANTDANTQPTNGRAWYGGGGWSHEGSNTQSRPGLNPSENIEDNPGGVGFTRFKTLLVCVSTGEVMIRISWVYHGTIIVPGSFKQER